MASFDTLVDKLDDVHKSAFAVVAVINGEDVKGIFDEASDEFEGVSDMIRTFEITMSDLPSTPILNEDSTVYMVSDGRTFTVHNQFRVGKQITLTLL